MYFDAPASRRMSSPPLQPAVTLIFDPHKLIRSSIGANEYSLSVLSELFKTFMRYRGNNICPDQRTDGRTDERTNERTGQPEK